MVKLYLQNDLKNIPYDKNGCRTRLKYLESYNNQTLTYQGEYVRCGYKTDGFNDYDAQYDNYDELDFSPTLLLKNITFQGVPITSHVWLNYNNSFIKLGRLHPNDKITFTAQIGTYSKGYYKNPVTDYQFNQVHNLKLTTNHPYYPLPTKNNLLVGYTMAQNAEFYLYDNRPYKNDFVASYDKWCQKHDKKELPVVASAEKLYSRYNRANHNTHSKLAKLNPKKRYTFIGTFNNYDYNSFQNHYTPTLRLSNIKHNGKIVTDLLSFNYTVSFMKLNELHTGDILKFNARVLVSADNQGLSGEIHYYKLGYPTKAKLLRKCDLDKRCIFPHQPKQKDLIVGYQFEHDSPLEMNKYTWFLLDLWKEWKLKTLINHSSNSNNKSLCHLAMMLLKQKLFMRNHKDNTINFTGNDYTPNVYDYLRYHHESLRKQLYVYPYSKTLIDLTTYHMITWKQLFNRVEHLLVHHSLSKHMKNPLKFSLHDINDNPKISLLEPLIAHNFAVYFYLDKIKHSNSQSILKLEKYFYQTLYEIKRNHNNQATRRLMIILYSRLLRDNQSQYSKVHLLKSTINTIQSRISDLQRTLHLTVRQQINDYKKVINYLDLPYLN